MKLKLVEKKKEAGDSVSFIFDPPAGGLNWTAGQFMVYSLPHKNPDIRGIQRFFTISSVPPLSSKRTPSLRSSVPFEKNPTITTRIFAQNRSSFKKALNEMKIGDLIDAKGPDGDFTLENLPAGRQGPNRNYVFIAGGIGITPYRAIILDLVHKNKPLNITLLYANSTPEFPFKEEFEKIASENPSFKIHYVISPEHIDKELVKQIVPNLNEPIYYVSGPEKMVEELSEMLKGMGIKEENIKQDFFPGYEAF